MLFFTAISFLLLGYRLGVKRLAVLKCSTANQDLKNSLMKGLESSQVDKDRRDFNTQEIKELL